MKTTGFQIAVAVCLAAVALPGQACVVTTLQNLSGVLVASQALQARWKEHGAVLECDDAMPDHSSCP